MTFQKMEKGSFFATRSVNQMSITFFLLEVGSSMIALFKALIWLYNIHLLLITTKKLKNKKVTFLVNFDLE